MHSEQKTAFLPPRHLRSSFLQTVLSSLKLRVAGPNPMVSASREVILGMGNGVRLQGFHSAVHGISPKGMVILIHGWEGSANSTYILHTGQFLYSHGYDVFRLNLRDHGDTHGLNEGLFYCTLLEEVFEAAGQAAALARGGPIVLMGFSLGGNFALRIARRLEERPSFALSHVFAVSPALDPARATDSIDAHPLLHWYFMKKWKRSLRRKQALFPHLYDFSPVLSHATIRGMTEELIVTSGLYPGVDEYFKGYTIGPDTLMEVRTPVTIVHSEDDPAVPVRDFPLLHIASRHRLIIHKYGGHNGFLYGVRRPSWYEHEVLAILHREGAET